MLKFNWLRYIHTCYSLENLLWFLNSALRSVSFDQTKCAIVKSAFMVFAVISVHVEIITFIIIGCSR